MSVLALGKIVADQARIDKWSSEFVLPEPNSGCWLWIGSLNRDGYGQVRVGKNTQRAHRIFYEHFKGPIPQGLVTDHLCRVRCCVNPDHLEAVTTKENVLRGESFSAVNRTKTHCDRGHLLAGKNVRMSHHQPPKRICIACERLSREPRADRSVSEIVRRASFCVLGHEFTEENSYISPRGHRKCKKCKRISSAKYRRIAAALAA